MKKTLMITQDLQVLHVRSQIHLDPAVVQVLTINLFLSPFNGNLVAKSLYNFVCSSVINGIYLVDTMTADVIVKILPTNHY